MNVLVCDDRESSREGVVSRLRTVGLQPTTLIGDDLLKELKVLFQRVHACRKDPPSYEHEQSVFDNADVVILDNNLTYLDVEDAPPLTAESIAGYVRAFTRAGYLVSLNMNPDVDFDLRYLVGDFSTRADLAINTEHLDNRSLWTGKPEDAAGGFCPWYWPRLNTAAARRTAQIKFLRTRLDEFVLSALGIDETAEELLSYHARGALSPVASASSQNEATSLRNVKFRHVFLTKDRSLPFKEDREKLDDAARNGNGAIHDLICRVVAADMDLWFRRDVMGPQEPLVDVPHLLMRFPFLLGDRAGDAQQWNRVVEAASPTFGLDPALYNEHLVAAEFAHGEWVQTRCFWWHRLKGDEQLNERFVDTQDEEWADVVFCEDESRFRNRRGSDDSPAPLEFSAEFESSWNRRYVAELGGIRYAPRTRLASY